MHFALVGGRPPEITQFRHVHSHNYVLRFDIPVNNPHSVGLDQSFSHLVDYLRCFCL